MFRNRLYYGIKPLFPAPMRMSVRRWFALRKRETVLDRWPILPGSEKRPKDWAGWPNGKQFALLLTHDVEGPEGLSRCRQLMQLEKKLGFRSSFNFIPEGEYQVASELLDELKAHGFEIGVHDLHHDGKLYSSRREFAQKALRINNYLQKWGAVGFRSGFMLHNLEWLHDLNVSYDSSTFDTDPFEPQPDGVGTIFPFWVPRNNSQSFQNPTSALGSSHVTRHSPLGTPPGYVELPYTLPQDSTIFLLLRERHPDIWVHKLDWIARHGGMALLAIHPDYVSFGSTDRSSLTYDALLYEEFLTLVKERYQGRYWHALPKEVAQFYSESRLTQSYAQSTPNVSESKTVPLSLCAFKQGQSLNPT